ncbi:MAG: ribonuclease J [Armatimonadota bacterium]
MTLQIIPLGGAGEIGKNMTAYRLGEEILVVDCGVMFPDQTVPGVDLLLPDISYLLENRHRIIGFVLTHGHEDHIGALPYVLRQLPGPLWATRLTLGLIQRKLHEHGLWHDTEWHLTEAGERVSVGSFDVEFVHVNHSIPDACSLVIRTPAGTVVHTSDFKFDQTPLDGRVTDMGALARAGDEGVLALVTDSTNADRPGATPSEQVVADGLAPIIRAAPGRVILTTFASNLWRVRQVLEIAQDCGRQVVLAGRSMQRNVTVARELGYFEFPQELFVRLDSLHSCADDELLILCTGSQGEPLAALSRIAMGQHAQIEVREPDTVIFSASPIPGNEALVWRTINNLVRRGAEVCYPPIHPDIHVSGHGAQTELLLMANLVRPKNVIPVHGEFRHQEAWRRLAAPLGCPVIVPTNGDVLELDSSGVRKSGRVVSGTTLVDGTGTVGPEDVVLRDRGHLAENGIFVVLCSVDEGTGRVLAGPDCIARGSLLEHESRAVSAAAREAVLRYLEGLSEEGSPDWGTVQHEIRLIVNRLLKEHTGRRPFVVPVILAV